MIEIIHFRQVKAKIPSELLIINFPFYQYIYSKIFKCQTDTLSFAILAIGFYEVVQDNCSSHKCSHLGCFSSAHIIYYYTLTSATSQLFLVFDCFQPIIPCALLFLGGKFYQAFGSNSKVYSSK